MSIISKAYNLIQKSVWITGGIFFLLGILTRFYSLEHPNEIVFDEFHFFSFVTQYEQGEYFFDIHPPLGKLLLWANAKWYGIEEMVESKKMITEEEVEIGSTYNEHITLAGIRSIPALFGAMLVPLMFFFAFLITKSLPLASTVGVITLFSPAFIVESQYVLMDSMLVFFIMLSTFFGILYIKNLSWKWWWGATIATAFAVSIKWTGLGSIALLGGIWIWVLIHNRNTFENIKKILLHALVFWTVVPLFYLFTFILHFWALPLSGTGDAFHTPEFRINLEQSYEDQNKDSSTYIPKSFFWNMKGSDTFLQKKEEEGETNEFDWDNWIWYGMFFELNRVMGERSSAIRDEHPFASRVEDWIQGNTWIFYWNKTDHTLSETGNLNTLWNNTFGWVFAQNTSKTCGILFQQQIHLFPNVYIWKTLPFFTLFLGSILFLSLIWYSLPLSSRAPEHTSTQPLMSRLSAFFTPITPHTLGVWSVVFLGITINILPFVFIDRPQFLYHAFTSVLFSFLAVGIALGIITHYLPFKNAIRWAIFGFITTLCLYYFLRELPLIYGFSFDECIGSHLFTPKMPPQ